MTSGLYVPTDEEIVARAVQLGLHGAGDASPLSPADRRQVARLISDEHRPAAPAKTASTLLSRFTYEVPAGTIVVDVVLVPTQKETPRGT